MYLVHEQKKRPGKWEVAWMWLPHFLAADRELHKLVDQKMTEEFRGQMFDGTARENPTAAAIVGKMNDRVMELILTKYPIHGLRRLLEGYLALEPDEEVTKP